MHNLFPYAIKKIDRVIEIANEAKESENYYDSFGLSLYISVTNDSKIVLSSKHWLKNCYIDVRTSTNDKVEGNELWDIVSKSITKSFERYDGIDWYIFVTNLNRSDTNSVYNSILSEIKKRDCICDTVEKWDVSGWKITEQTAVKIPWLNQQ